MASLAELASPDVRADRVLVVPVGATEQHGAHLPLGTDTEIAVALAAGLAQERAEVIVAPPVAYGSSGEHAGFAGTLSVGREVTQALLVELGRSAGESFGRLLLVSAHGGNAEPVAAAVARLRSEGRSVLAWSPRWRGDAHAGRTETSLMLAIAPEQVALERAAPGNVAALAGLLPRLRSEGVLAVSPNGVLGAPTGATASEGRTLLASAVAELAALIEMWPAQ